MSREHRDYFNRLAGEWDELMADDPRLQRYMADFVSQGQYVLDLGAGTGRVSRHLTELVGNTGLVVVEDIAEEMLREGGRKLHERLLRLCDDACTLALRPAVFHRVICYSAFPHFTDKLAALEEMRRVLLPGGRLLILHTDSSSTLNQFHASLPEPVCYDLLPGLWEMEQLLKQSGLIPLSLQDREGLYRAEAGKPHR